MRRISSARVKVMLCYSKTILIGLSFGVKRNHKFDAKTNFFFHEKLLSPWAFLKMLKEDFLSAKSPK